MEIVQWSLLGLAAGVVAVMVVGTWRRWSSAVMGMWAVGAGVVGLLLVVTGAVAVLKQL